jgi:hypothetical protein
MSYFADGEQIVTSGWTPKAPYMATSGIVCNTSGAIVVDLVGTRAGAAGATNLTVTMIAGQKLDIGIIQVHSGSGSFTAFY